MVGSFRVFPRGGCRRLLPWASGPPAGIAAGAGKSSGRLCERESQEQV